MGRLKNRKGYCPKCGEIVVLTKHHCLPKRFYGANEAFILICRTCHNEIERILPRNRRLSKEEYLDIHRAWLKDKPIIITEDNHGGNRTGF